MLTSSLIITIFVVFSQLASSGVVLAQSSWFSERIRLSDVSVITFYAGKMTNGRRSSPVPQLQCVGGNAGCSRSFLPSSAQCYNRGNDGVDVVWECTANLYQTVTLGRASVSCEGYDYPDDPFVLRGSCGLQYELMYSRDGHPSFKIHPIHEHAYSYRSARRSSVGDVIASIIACIIIILVCVLFCKLCCWCCCRRPREFDDDGFDEFGPAPTIPTTRPYWYYWGDNYGYGGTTRRRADYTVFPPPATHTATTYAGTTRRTPSRSNGSTRTATTFAGTTRR
jgi:hypothetical protein